MNKATAYGWRDMVQYLISLGAPIDGDSEKFQEDFGFLCCASSFGHADIVQLLLDSGARPGRYEIVTAASHGDTEIVRLLLNHGARSKDALAAAARRGYFGTLKLLVSSGADVNEGVLPPLIGATAAEHTDMVCYLVEHDATQYSLEMQGEVSEKGRLLQLGFYHFWLW